MILSIFPFTMPILVAKAKGNAMVMYFLIFFIIRYVGPIYWGYLSYALAFGGLFSLITDLGFNTAYMKSISGEGDKAHDMGTYLFIKIILNIVYIAVG